MSIRSVADFPWEGEYPSSTFATLLRYGRESLDYTKEFYEVRTPSGELILGAGVALWSFARPPELWTILAKPYFLNLRESLRLTRAALSIPAEKYANLVCDVEKNSKKELHFVKHMGWVPTGQPSLRPNGNQYIQFKVK